MTKGFLRTGFLIVVLFVVLAIMVFAMNLKSADSAYRQSANQTLLKQFVIAGGPIVWFVLLPMSVVTVFLAIKYCLTIRRNKLVPEQAGSNIMEVVERCGISRLEESVGGQDDFISTAVLEAVGKASGDWHRMRSILAESLQNQGIRFLRKVEWLNLIGNVSPMVGLFGTVFGMIKLFDAIVTAGGQPQPAQLAAGISVALVTTFWGLFIAIPALAIHGILRNRIETFVSDAEAEAENIVRRIRRSLKVQARTVRTEKTNPPISQFSTKPAARVNPTVPLR